MTRIEEVDDVVREESMEQKKKEEDESSEKQRPRASKILHQRVDKKEFNTKLRLFRFEAGITGRGQTVANKSRKRDKSQSTRRKEKNLFFGGKRTRDKSCAQHRGPQEVDGRMDLPTAHGMAA